jgi:hypothetical protein
MGYVLVLIFAAAAGVGVYFLTMRVSRVDGGVVEEGFTGPAPEAGRVAPGSGAGRPASAAGQAGSGRLALDGGYMDLAPGRRSWQTRAVGVMGLVVLVSLTALAIGLLVFLGGSAIARLLSDAAQSGGVNGPAG